MKYFVRTAAMLLISLFISTLHASQKIVAAPDGGGPGVVAGINRDTGPEDGVTTPLPHALAAPVYSVWNTTMRFNGVYEGRTKVDSVWVKNAGTAVLTISSVQIVRQSGVGSFSGSPGTASISPNDSAKFYITYTAGYYKAPDFWYCIFNHNAATTPDTIQLIGSTIRKTVWWVTTSTVNVNDCYCGNTKTGTFDCGVAVAGPLLIDSARSSNPFFSLSPTQAQINYNGVLTFTVTFAPTTSGIQTGKILVFVRCDDYSDTLEVTVSGNGIYKPCPWTFTNTGITHTVIITLAASPSINNVPLKNGDYIGAFYDSLGIAACAGYTLWNGTSNVSVAAFGKDPTSAFQDGYATGEVFKWKIYSVADAKHYDAIATYLPAGGIITSTSQFLANGISQLLTLKGSTVHSLSLRSGWSIISSFIEPIYTSLDSVFKPVIADVIIVKNADGKSFIPSIPVNTIGPWVKTAGYQVKMAGTKSLDIRGTEVQAESLPISLPAGWSILPYVCTADAPIASTLNSIVGAITIVKDQDGKTFIPSIPVNTIGTMKCGQAYQIKLNTAQTFTYPALTGSALKTSSRTVSRSELQPGSAAHYAHVAATNANATIVIDVSVASRFLHPGDEVGVYTRSGALAGSAEYHGTNFSIPVWGDDPTTPGKDGMEAHEPYDLRFWCQQRALESRLSGVVWKEGAGEYEENGIHCLAGFNSPEGTEIPTEFVVLQNYPNPFNPSTKIVFSIPAYGHTRVTVFNTLGQPVAELVNGLLDRGYHEVTFDAGTLSSGMYYYKITYGANVTIKKMLRVK